MSYHSWWIYKILQLIVTISYHFGGFIELIVMLIPLTKDSDNLSLSNLMKVIILRVLCIFE